MYNFSYAEILGEEVLENKNRKNGLFLSQSMKYQNLQSMFKIQPPTSHRSEDMKGFPLFDLEKKAIPHIYLVKIEL